VLHGLTETGSVGFGYGDAAVAVLAPTNIGERGAVDEEDDDIAGGRRFEFVSPIVAVSNDNPEFPEFPEFLELWETVKFLGLICRRIFFNTSTQCGASSPRFYYYFWPYDGGLFVQFLQE
jgi:hypothetical protein